VSGGEGYFDERVAARYDESAEEMFEPVATQGITPHHFEKKPAATP
jgi:hypothetical protein